jgi:hypothetical protein
MPGDGHLHLRSFFPFAMRFLLHLSPRTYYYTLSDVLDTDKNSGRLDVRTAPGISTGIRRHFFQTLSLKVFLHAVACFGIRVEPETLNILLPGRPERAASRWKILRYVSCPIHGRKPDAFINHLTPAIVLTTKRGRIRRLRILDKGTRNTDSHLFPALQIVDHNEYLVP